MKVLFSYWGFTEPFDKCHRANTPDGGRFTRPIFVDKLVENGHTVISLQKRREKYPYKNLIYDDKGFPDGDILFIEWRWPIYKNSGKGKFEPDLERQTELLKHYHGEIPVVIWDADLKMTEEDEKRWPEAIIADPTLDPKKITRDRVRLPFSSDFKVIMDPYFEPIRYGYIGNNYERDEMFMKYYNTPAAGLRVKGIQTSVYGNWLLKSPERMSPEEVVKKFKYVSFVDRVGFTESMKLLNSFICSTHISKPEYADVGFASPRYLENIATCTPALVPEEFKYKNILGKFWVVKDGVDVIKKTLMIKAMTPNERLNVVNAQAQELIEEYPDFKVETTVSLLESLV